MKAENKKSIYSQWHFIVFPAIAMLLGWGLRGFIGGGPFGAMIPGAMVAISISLLLDLPPAVAAMFAVFSVVGIGLGGEMTYGQTLGFLRHPETVWWGTIGTTVKGGVWGLLGGIIMGLGLLYHRVPKKVIIYTLLLLLLGMLIGFKLINQPMVIYFSDPAKPRPESWAALLVGSLVLLLYLRTKIEMASFKLIKRFALWGLLGGALGFGLGGFWMVLGSQLPKDGVFQSWWKMMEFTFGLLLGAAYGRAAWLSRHDLDPETRINNPYPDSKLKTTTIELLGSLIIGFLIFWFFSAWLEPVVDAGRMNHDFSMVNWTDLAKLLSNYAFYGLIMIVAVMRYPNLAWQIAITLTFSHTVIDLMDSVYPNSPSNTLLTPSFLYILSSSTIVALATYYLQRHANILHRMFLLLIWSTVAVAFSRLTLKPELLNLEGLSIADLVFGRFFVHLVFTISAIYCTWLSFVILKKRLN